jgi:hypothetical protein
MNIVKLQNQLKSIPVETLIKYVQGANPEVPSYLALAEIKSRKDMEAKYASQNQQAPESSVAEDLTQMPTQGGLQTLAGNSMSAPAATQVGQGTPTMSADQGVASLDTGNMYDEQNFAGGGIIAFDDGGDVVASDMAPASADMSYDALIASGVHPMNAAALKGMLPASKTYTGATASPASASPYGADMASEMMRVSPEALRYSSYGVGRGTSPEAYSAYTALRKEMGSPGYAGGGMVAFDKGGKVPSFAGPGGSYINPEMAYNDPALMAQYQEYLKANPIYVRNPQAGLKAFLSDLNKTSEVMRTTMSPSFLSQVGLAGYKSGESAMADTAQKAKERYFGAQPIISSAATTIPGAEILGSQASADRLSNPMYATDYARAVETAGRKQPTRTDEVATSDVTKSMPGSAPQPQQAGIDSLLEKTDGVAKDRMARYKEMIGEDPERARLEELARKYETGAGEQERMAPWMALSKAGFTMAGGKSPFAIQNLSEGAVAGLADYAQAKDKLDKLTEKQIDIRTKMGQARRAEDIAAATYGLNSEERIEARNAQIKLKDMEEKNAFARTKYAADVSTKNAMIAAAKKSDYETFLKNAEADEDNYKTVKDKDGNVKKVLDINKVTQTWRSYSGSSGLDDDKLAVIWDNNKYDKDFIKKYPTPADYILDQRAKLSGTSAAPAASSASAGFTNFRQSSK